MHADKLISSSYDSTINVWSTGTWVCERTLGGHVEEEVVCLVVLGDKLFTGSSDSSVKVWGS